MNKELVVVLNTPYTLNFMIYLQNLYLNERGNESYLKFPAYKESIAFHPDFERQFL